MEVENVLKNYTIKSVRNKKVKFTKRNKYSLSVSKNNIVINDLIHNTILHIPYKEIKKIWKRNHKPKGTKISKKPFNQFKKKDIKTLNLQEFYQWVNHN